MRLSNENQNMFSNGTIFKVLTQQFSNMELFSKLSLTSFNQQWNYFESNVTLLSI